MYNMYDKVNVRILQGCVIMKVPDMIQAKELKYYINNEDVLIIDLRDGKDYLKGHILGAINYSYDEIYSNVEHIPREKTILFYCDRGNKSLMVAARFTQFGYVAMSLAEGYAGYIKYNKSMH